MRPVALHIDGFGSFREPVDLDFEGVDFFALVGPTGAGKSTVIDAMCFALYGSVPRYADEKLVGRAVSLGRSEAKVSLTFDVRGSRYLATRVVRVRDGKVSGSPKVALERVAADGTTELLADKVKPMKTAVEDLLGLSFQHFTKCVVLPQGEFAAFLHDDPSKRQELLVRLLDIEQYKRVGQRARARANEAEARVALSDQQLERFADATEARLGAAQAYVEQVSALRAEIVDAKPNDEKLAGEIAAAVQRGRDAETALRTLRAVRIPDDVLSLAEELRGARDLHDEANELLGTADDAVERLQEAVASFGDVVALDRLRAAHEEFTTVGDRRTELIGQRDEPADVLERCDTLLTGYADAISAATTELEAMQAANAHAALRGELEVGEPCPVCEQAVHELPPILSTDALDDQRAKVASLHEDQREAGKMRETAMKQCSGLDARLANLDEREAELRTLLDDAPGVDEIAAMLREASASADALRKAQADQKQRKATSRNAAKAVQELEKRVNAVGKAFVAQRDPLVALGAPAPVGDDLTEQWRALEGWAIARVPEQEAAGARAASDVARSTDERTAALSALAARGVDAGVALRPSMSINDMETATIESRATAVHNVERIEAAIAEAETVRATIVTAKREQQVAHTLANLLRADRFERWLVTEAIDVLVSHASATLYELSAGQYSLACEEHGEFSVIDHANADERRAARTLSGGETFQASLALALALSEQIATLSSNAQSRLDAIFLDEGFGTLDADALDIVAATIEHLGADGRVVGIVTHVPALAERVPVRFRVQKNDRTSSVVREEL
jgi:DNA repair protein SbcC/Rad50